MSKWSEKSTINHQGITWKQGLWVVLIIWLLGVIIDRIWFSVDLSVPEWDQADYLKNTMVYWDALKTPEFFNSEWWRSFWLLSNKIPPLTYILTAPFLSLFGVSADTATLVLSLFSAILLLSVYSLGILLFNVRIALYACILCQLLPGLYLYRLEFLLDYPLSSVVTFSFACLSWWKFKQNSKIAWWLGILWGLSLGTALMVKQTALFFLFLPILWVFASAILTLKLSRLVQLILGLLVSGSVFFPWYRTNWLLIFTSGKRATIDAAIAEGDPTLNSLEAWTYYGKNLPYLLSWPLLIIPIICLIYIFIRRLFKPENSTNSNSHSLISIIGWLGIFLVGGYLLSSVNPNKDARYITPLLPVLSLILSAAIFGWRGMGRNYFRVGIVALAGLLTILNLFPLNSTSTFLTQKLSPRVQHHPYLGGEWHHREVIAETIKTSPYLRSNIGVLPSTAEINQHNISFYGSIPNFQVYGRQVGVRDKNIEQDVRSLDWFLTKTGEQGSIPEIQKTTVNLVENSEEFKLQNSWQLPNLNILKLYHRISPSVKVDTLAYFGSKVKLDRVIVPEKSPPGFPIPVTYQWSGSWQQLQDGIVILKWYRQGENREAKWLHDHGIAMGNLHAGNLKKEQLDNDFQVIENTAMLPETNLPPGNYTLTATYLNRQTGETYPIETPPVTLTLDKDAPSTPAPELDLVTQLRQLAPNLAKGIEGLEPIFAEIGRIGQYDPIQDYLPVSELALSYRLSREPNLDYAYTLVLARALQQDVGGAIAALKQLIEIDPNNPYNHAYLAFVYLYDWRGKEAEKALQPAFELQPDLEILKPLDAIAAVMQGNLVKAWRIYQAFQSGSL